VPRTTPLTSFAINAHTHLSRVFSPFKYSATYPRGILRDRFSRALYHDDTPRHTGKNNDCSIAEEVWRVVIDDDSVRRNGIGGHNHNFPLYPRIFLGRIPLQLAQPRLPQLGSADVQGHACLSPSYLSAYARSLSVARFLENGTSYEIAKLRSGAQTTGKRAIK